MSKSRDDETKLERGVPRNRVQCMDCGAVLESTHRHDFVQCQCPNHSFVDGGHDYIRIGGMDMRKVRVIPPDEEMPLPPVSREGEGR